MVFGEFQARNLALVSTIFGNFHEMKHQPEGLGGRASDFCAGLPEVKSGV